MPHIQQLESHVADLIAAGEVVERPASVVKELVENALDAGAKSVVVEIERGGMGLIRVTDDGCGIAPEELATAFLRHATSKLREAGDLAAIGTLGFRGEALAAIASVSHAEILTRPAGADLGASLSLEGGVPGAVTEAGAPLGTTVTVRDLFYNTPARLKFMKKDSAETAAVAGLLQHLALSRPDAAFQLFKDGAESLRTPGDGRLDSAVYAALGRDFARGLTAAAGQSGEIKVSGFISKPLCGRGSRGMQTFFVNGRFIKSQLLTAALEEGYRNQLMKGRFPGCVLAVTLPPHAVDVNVHPAKTVVKFSREHDVFDAVYHAVLSALERDGLPAGACPAPQDSPRSGGEPSDFFRSVDAGTFRARAGLPSRGVASNPGGPADRGARSGPAGPAAKPRGWNTEWRATAKVADSAAGPAAYRSAPGGATLPPPPAEPGPAAPADTRPFVPAIPSPPEQPPLFAGERPVPWRVAGEVLNTYIVCEDVEKTVWLIDKHAAHERMNFDRLVAAAEPPMRQILLCPIAAELPREDGALLLENRETLESLGFACEDFGDGAVLVREIPADLDAAVVPAALEELAETLRGGRGPTEKRQAMLRTVACKAAIKGGWTSSPQELRVLVDKVQSGEIQYCPHGRPVKVKLTQYELEKMFKRA